MEHAAVEVAPGLKVGELIDVVVGIDVSGHTSSDNRRVASCLSEFVDIGCTCHVDCENESFVNLEIVALGKLVVFHVVLYDVRSVFECRIRNNRILRVGCAHT
jgi:hypothetical protein